MTAFDPSDCPLDCFKPYEAVCPTNAIVLKKGDSLEGGVINERCYGCGCCLPVCPYDNIKAITYLRDAITTAQLVRRNDVDAVEIHTNGSSANCVFLQYTVAVIVFLLSYGSVLFTLFLLI
ncbi:ABC transporter E family member 1 [Bienertia sinuspersici]